MQNPNFVFYTRPNGHTEFTEYMDTLPLKERAKLETVIRIVQEKGLLEAQRLQLISKLQKNLYELRSRQGKTYQRALYFHVVESTFMITHGFSKKTNKTPQLQIQHALDLRSEFYDSMEDLT